MKPRDLLMNRSKALDLFDTHELHTFHTTVEILV